MNIVICVRRLANGELNPFDASAYEAALRLRAGEVTLLSMGPMSVEPFLQGLTRLGAARGILLSDHAFAGADTLATAYTLSLALQRLGPDLILCGRQAIDGDTGQVGPELAAMLGCALVTNGMSLELRDGAPVLTTRTGETVQPKLPAVVTLERIHTLRLPSIRSKVKPVEVWNAETLGADVARCGQAGSPTQVVQSFQNQQDRRKCTFVQPGELRAVMEKALSAPRHMVEAAPCATPLKRVWIVGEAPRTMAETISDDIAAIPLDEPAKMAAAIRAGDPEAVLWGSDTESRRIAAQTAALLQTGLCADCTRLETDGKELWFYRPAFAGDVLAKIRCRTRPKMATVRTVGEAHSRLVVGLGYGVREMLPQAEAFAAALGAEIAASRKLVDHDYLPYPRQVGLTGRSVSPDVYLALGISGAVHHIAGIRSSGVIIAVNPDKDAEIFKYADFGIVCKAEEIF